MTGLTQQPLSDVYLESFIQLYEMVRYDQIERIMKSFGYQEDSIHKNMKTLRKYGNVVYDNKAKIFFAQDNSRACEYNLKHYYAALWVLIDFIKKIEYHYPMSSPFLPSILAMSIEERIYEVVYVAKGQGTFIDNQLRAARVEMLHRLNSVVFEGNAEEKDIIINSISYIVIMEDMSETEFIKDSRIRYFCELDDDNRPIFYEQQAAELEESNE